jgi:hypothetical protein
LGEPAERWLARRPSSSSSASTRASARSRS